MSKIKVSWTIEEKGTSIKVMTHDGAELVIIGPLEGVEDLQREVEALCSEFRMAFEQAKNELLSRDQKPKETTSQDPQELWAILKREPKENMIKLFNSQNENVRKLVAQYVFENVNVFSGPGAIFAELYNQETGLLEP